MSVMEIMAILLLTPVVIGLWIGLYVFWVEMIEHIKRVRK